jgi:hypothetical protein
MPQPELTLASLGETTDLTDRERLALAFGILREKGWFAPVEWSVTLCCTGHGWQKVVEHFGMDRQQWMDTEYDDEPPTIWWHSVNDSGAFLGTMTESPMSEAMEERIDAVFDGFMADETTEDPEAATAQWMEDHQEELDADEMIERTTVLVDLVDDLSLHWSGGMGRMAEAVEVLRSVGLTVSEAISPHDTLRIHPRHQPMIVKVRKVDGKLALWFDADAEGQPLVVLSRSDAEGLIDMLQQGLATPTSMRFAE